MPDDARSGDGQAGSGELESRPEAKPGSYPVVLTITIALICVTAIVLHFPQNFPSEFAVVFTIGAATGAIEMVGKYREQPVAALMTPGAMLYVLINAGAAVLALFLIRSSTSLAAAVGAGAVEQVLWASFGAMAFFRSSLFKARLGDEEVPIGPAILFDGLLTSADLDANRRLAASRFEFASALMRDVDFAKASAEAPALCFQSMQNFPQDEQNIILARVAELQTPLIESRQKSVILALMLTLWFGRDVVKRVVDVNRGHWRVTVLPAPAPAEARAPAATDQRQALIKEARASRGMQPPGP